MAVGYSGKSKERILRNRHNENDHFSKPKQTPTCPLPPLELICFGSTQVIGAGVNIALD
jgi:hypothetical protein